MIVCFEKVTSAFHHRGLMIMDSLLGKQGDVALTRTIFPSIDKPLAIDKVIVTNRAAKPIKVELENTRKTMRTNPGSWRHGRI